jgi:hypothetical protein
MKFQGLTFALVFHWCFNENNYILFYKWWWPIVQILIQYPNYMISIYFENQILNSIIQAKYPSHINVILFEFQQWLEGSIFYLQWTWMFDHNTCLSCHFERLNRKTQSYTKTSLICANLMRPCIDPNNCKM